MPRRRLLTPGPTQVPEDALLTMAEQVTHHRTPQFKALFAEVQAGLKEVCQTAGDVLVLACSGTGAMEAAMVNAVPRGGKAIVLDAGVFAHRWADIAKAFGIDVVRIDTPWGQAVDPAAVAAALAAHPDAAAVFGTLMESSTGVVHDVEAIGREVKKTSALWVVDAISGAGCLECRTDLWGIDMLVIGSQKALMLPPGLGFVAVSDKACRQMERVQPQAFYFDLNLHRRKLHESNDTPWTPALTLIRALAKTLANIRSTGIEATWAKTHVLAEATRAGVAALGLALFAQRPADGLTAVRFPAGLDGSKLLQILEQRYGVKLAGGQGQLKGQIFRIGHFGMVDELDVLSVLAALELALDEMGQRVELGAAVAAAGRVFRRSQG